MPRTGFAIDIHPSGNEAVPGDGEATARVAIRDLAAAAEFYEGKLGLKVHAREGDQAVGQRTGSTRLNAYVSQFAGTNRATAVTGFVGAELEAIVATLKVKGVRFEHDELPRWRHSYQSV